MHRARVEQQVNERHRKKEEAGDGGDGGGSGEAGAKQHEVQDETPLAPIGPEEIAIFIDHEKLRGNLRGEPPFPFGHDRLSGADDADGGVIARPQFGQQTGAAGWIGVVGDTRNLSTKPDRCAGEAGDQIDLHRVAENLVEFGNQRIEQLARAALNQQDPG